jgi:hypothetical protein
MEIKEWVDFITKGFLRACFGIFLIWCGFAVNNSTKPSLGYQETAAPQKFNKNEVKYNEKVRDSIMSLPIEQQYRILDSLAREYSKRHFN